MAEQYWYTLTESERIHYERCISAIMRFYHGNTYQVRQMIYKAQDAGYTRSMLVKAIVWRLAMEIDDADF